MTIRPERPPGSASSGLPSRWSSPAAAVAGSPGGAAGWTGLKEMVLARCPAGGRGLLRLAGVMLL